MKLDWELQEYLDANGLTAMFDGERFEVSDKDGRVICTGATVHTAVRKAVWLNACPCQLTSPGPQRK